jgi:RNA polymerase sigma factor (sigma-70 family)
MEMGYMNNELKVNIINDYEMLIDKYARMFYYNNAKNNYFGLEDLKSEIILNLLKDLDKLDEVMGKSVFIENSIKWSCKKFYQNKNTMKRRGDATVDSLDRKIVHEEESKTLLELIEYDYNLEDKIIEKDLVKEIIKYADLISERSGQIIRLFLAGYTFEEMGKILHLSKQNVNQIFNRAVKKIKHKCLELS